MTTNADNTPGVTGQEIIAHSLPSYNEDDDAQAQRLEDAAELPFSNDNAEDEEHGSSNQTSGLFNRRTILLGGTILVLCAVVGLSSATLTSSSNSKSMVIESFNSAAGAAKSSKAPTAKSGKSSGSGCHPNDNTAPPGGNCALCCPTDDPISTGGCGNPNDPQTCSTSGTCLCGV